MLAPPPWLCCGEASCSRAGVLPRGSSARRGLAVRCAAGAGGGARNGVSASAQAQARRPAREVQQSSAVLEAYSPSTSQQRGRPLLNGGTAVEEEALASALRTVAAQENGQLGSRRLRYECADVLDDAYARCGVVTEDYGRTFYMATQLMTEKRRKAIWAIYVWCRRTDELVDGPNSPYITPAALDRWTERLEQAFDGRPFDLLDAALTDTVASFPVDVTPFYDMIDGMRMDLVKWRYTTFDELYEYCYRVAGTVALMSVPIMGISAEYTGPVEPVYRAALGLGMANQLTNILRDVGEDARTRGRVYIPLEDLAAFGISDTEVINNSLAPVAGGPVDPRWQAMMKFQISRARQYFTEAEEGVAGLEESARWPVWAALILYRQILDAIEANGYDNFNMRAYVPSYKKLLLLPVAYIKAAMTPTLRSPATTEER